MCYKGTILKSLLELIFFIKLVILNPDKISIPPSSFTSHLSFIIFFYIYLYIYIYKNKERKKILIFYIFLEIRNRKGY